MYVGWHCPDNQPQALEKTYFYKKKENMGVFLKNFQLLALAVYDELCILTSHFKQYSIEMGQYQNQWLQAHTDKLDPPYELRHPHPYELKHPQTQQTMSKTKSNELNLPLGTMLQCTNNCCSYRFEFTGQLQGGCIYHPGHYIVQSKNELEKEVWSCCRGVWSR